METCYKIALSQELATLLFILIFLQGKCKAPQPSISHGNTFFSYTASTAGLEEYLGDLILEFLSDPHLD